MPYRSNRKSPDGRTRASLQGRPTAGAARTHCRAIPRQKEVMQLVAEGLSNKQIALQLGISPRTVENYRAWVMERMDASNVAELVRKVLIIERGN
ncbi:MAG: hypothetical protein EHM67_17080 [Hyphomicrobiaceae bacterium]|nr:MAG: hypothetical protein EHM67_17080 [Hyphomicrobiaceae bacterium]